MHAVRAPDVAVEPAERVEVLDRAAAVQLEAVLLLVARLGQVRVQDEAVPPRQHRRLLHQPAGRGERRARRDGDADEAVVVLERGEPLGVGEHGVDLLDERVRRQPALRLAEVHGAARRDDAHAELARRPHLGFDEAGLPARKDVVVVEDRRAAGQRELREPVRAAAYSDSSSIRAQTG